MSTSVGVSDSYDILDLKKVYFFLEAQQEISLSDETKQQQIVLYFRLCQPVVSRWN